MPDYFFRRIRSILPVLVLTLLAASPAAADELWGGVLHKQHRLYGRIYVADVQAGGWSGELPSGWIKLEGPERSGRYDIDLGRLRPEAGGSGTRFLATRWDFVNSAWQNGFTGEALVKTIDTLRSLPEIRFREDAELEESRDEFDLLDRSRIEEFISENRLRIEFPISAAGAVAVRTTRGRLVKVFVENYSSTGFIRFFELEGESGGNSGEGRFIVSLQSSWRRDLDGDGLIDLQWNPISHRGSSTFEVMKSYAVGLIKIYRR